MRILLAVPTSAMGPSTTAAQSEKHIGLIFSKLLFVSPEQKRHKEKKMLLAKLVEVPISANRPPLQLVQQLSFKDVECTENQIATNTLQILIITVSTDKNNHLHVKD